MTSNYNQGLFKEYELLLSKYEKSSEEYRLLKYEYRILKQLLKRQNRLYLRQKEKFKEKLTEKDVQIEALQMEVLRLNGYLNIDGTNSGIPTSKTPLSKKKVVPNSRKKGKKKKGGQQGHAKSKLKGFDKEDVTEEQKHIPDACPFCGGAAKETGTTVQKDELDYEVVVIKRRHKFPTLKCQNCGKEFRAPIPENLKEENQYGSHVKTLGLSLMNVGNVSVNKVRKMIYGLSAEEINPTEGYLIKQQKKAAKGLTEFIEELRKACCSLEVLYWDDTVIDINTKRSCLRFYGNEKLPLYQAHRRKDKEGLDDDRILQLLSKDTIVMHDHNRVNYNKQYSFSNIECNVHLLRDLQKASDNLQHKWSSSLKELLTKTNQERNEAIDRGAEAFEAEYIKGFFENFEEIMLLAAKENKEDFSRYYGGEERTLILRILDYKDNYLAWVTNFNLPFSNNLSERALRGVKSKMKVSGQFQNEETAKCYAIVKSYIETCYRNGINETEALLRLCDGKPYTLNELMKASSDK